MRRLIALLGVLGILAACGGAPAAPPTATSAPATPTRAAARATATPRPTPAPPTDTPAPPTAAPLKPESLLQRPNVLAFIAEDGALSLATTEGQIAPIWAEQPVESFAWAPDGASIAFVAGGKLRLWSGAGGAVKELGGDIAPQGRFSWRADSALIAIETSAAGLTPTLRLVTLDGSAPPVFPGLEDARAPMFGPGGTALLAMKNLTPTAELAESPLSTPYLWPAAGVEPLAYADSRNVMSWDRVGWRTDGAALAVSNLLLNASGFVEAQIAPPALGLTGQLTAEQVANGASPDIGIIAMAGLVAPAPDQPDNKQTELAILLRVPNTQTVIWRSVPRRDPGFFWQVSPVSWTRTGRNLAFAGAGQPADSGTSGAGVWVAAGDGAGLRLVPGSAGAELSEAGAIPEAPQWSGDGMLLLWAGGAPDQREIALWPLDGPQSRTLFRGSKPRWRP